MNETAKDKHHPSRLNSPFQTIVYLFLLD